MLQVNNASVQGAAVDDLRDISRERLERTFNTNVIAMFNLVQVCLMSWPAFSGSGVAAMTMGHHSS